MHGKMLSMAAKFEFGLNVKFSWAKRYQETKTKILLKRKNGAKLKACIFRSQTLKDAITECIKIGPQIQTLLIYVGLEVSVGTKYFVKIVAFAQSILEEK